MNKIIFIYLKEYLSVEIKINMFHLVRFCLVALSAFCGLATTTYGLPVETSIENQIMIPTTLSLRVHPLQNKWNTWKQKHGKQYDSQEEESLRFNIFTKNHQFIQQSNSETSSYVLSLNQFADLSAEEWSHRFSLMKVKEEKQGYRFVPDYDTIVQAPTSLDWRESTKNPRKVKAVVGIKNQQQCGSCWAFSTVASIEGAWALSGKALTSLSEQQLVDCSSAQGNEGCNGGLMDSAFQYVIANGGICSEQDYPYQAQDGTCEASSCKSAATISSYVDIESMNETAIFAAIQNGPISIAIEADQQSFQFYSGGVFSDPGCGTNLDHGVNLVGYGEDAGKHYWILRNSWGTSWGEKGYMRILRNKNICGLASSPSMPVV